MKSIKFIVSLSVLFALFGLQSAVAAEKLTPVFDVENPDRSAYQQVTSFTISPPFVNNFASFPTPQGVRYVVEYVALACTTPSVIDEFPQALVLVRVNTASGGSTTYSVPSLIMTPTGSGAFSGYVWSGSAQVKLYADPDKSVSGSSAILLNVFHTEFSVTANCSATVTGHTVAP